MFYENLWFFVPDDEIFPLKLGNIHITKGSLGLLLCYRYQGYLNDECINLFIHLTNYVKFQMKAGLPNAVAIPTAPNELFEPQQRMTALSGDPQSIKNDDIVEKDFCDAMSRWYCGDQVGFLPVVLDVYRREGKFPEKSSFQ